MSGEDEGERPGRRSTSAWLVDGTNVVGSRPDGWWRDRPGAFARLVARLGVLAARGDDVTVVFDGRPSPALAEGPHGDVAVRWARRLGPDAADDVIVALVAASAGPARPLVVTSDRGLSERVRALGADVVGAGTLLGLLDELEGRGSVV